MKKVTLFAAMAAMMLASCSETVDFTKEDVNNSLAENTPTAVQFGTYMGKTSTTRAGKTGDITTAGDLYVASETNDAKNGFGVFAYLTSTTLSPSGDPAKYSVSTAPNFMYNQQVKASAATSPTWSYDPVKYWPNGEDGNNTANNPSNTATQDAAQYLNFFAYAPYAEVTASTGAPITGATTDSGITALPKNTDTENPKISYTLASGEKFVDLLWGLRDYSSESDLYKLAAGTETAPTADGDGNYYNVNLTKQNTTETVKFLFKHALAKIGGHTAKDDETAAKTGVKVVYDIDGNGSGTTGYGDTDTKTLVTISSISINSGTYTKDGKTVKKGTDGATFSETLYNSGKFDIVTGTWSDQTTPTSPSEPTISIVTNATKTESGTTTSTGEMNSDIAEPAAAPTYSSSWTPVGVTTTAKDVYAEDKSIDPIYLIPGSGDQKLTVTVTYIVRTYDANLATSASGEGTWTKVTQTITNVVTLPDDVIKSNKAYTLIIHLGLTSIKFSAKVADWETTTTTSDGSGGTTTTENTKEIWLPSNVVTTTP